jgi:hypothetical protein
MIQEVHASSLLSQEFHRSHVEILNEERASALTATLQPKFVATISLLRTKQISTALSQSTKVVFLSHLPAAGHRR